MKKQISSQKQTILCMHSTFVKQLINPLEMNIIDSKIYNQVKEIRSFKLGDLFFFENIVISQINEGKHVCIESAKDCYKVIHDFYGTNKPFGYISNRINKYSIEVLDYPKHASIFPSLELYGIVGYSHFNEMNINIEKQFSKLPFFGFNTIEEAFGYINDFILSKSTTMA